MPVFEITTFPSKSYRILVDTFGTGTVEADVIEEAVRDNFKLTPRVIIESLSLRRLIYRKTAAYGHFGPHRH